MKTTELQFAVYGPDGKLYSGVMPTADGAQSDAQFTYAAQFKDRGHVELPSDQQEMHRKGYRVMVVEVTPKGEPQDGRNSEQLTNDKTAKLSALVEAVWAFVKNCPECDGESEIPCSTGIEPYRDCRLCTPVYRALAAFEGRDGE